MEDVEQQDEQKQEKKKAPPKFPYPVPKGHLQIAHPWFDEIISQIDNIAEMKVVWYIYRHTVGFHKPFQAVTLSTDDFMNGRMISKEERMDRGTDLSKPAVIAGLTKAEDHGYILVEVNNRDKARIRKSYRLHFDISPDVKDVDTDVNDSDIPEESDVKNVNADVKDLYPDVKDVDSRCKDSGHRTVKDNEKKSSKDTDKESNVTRTRATISDFDLTEGEERIREWGRKLKVIFPKDQAKVKEYCSILEATTYTFEEFESLHAAASREVQGKADTRVKLGNMANGDTINLWEKERQFAADPLGLQSNMSDEAVMEEEAITEEYVWQPPQAMKADYFVKNFMMTACCARGARDAVRQYQREVCQIYQDSTKERDEFEAILNRVERETKGEDMPVFMTRLYRVMGVEMATSYPSTQVVESTIMEAVI